MSDNIGKCPEMIGYVGDVQNLSENRGVAVSKTNIIQWVIRANSVVFATLFYSKDDVYHVGSMKQELLKINSDLKFRQISNIEEFINYIDTGMDRNEHPVKDIEMINVYSTWEKVDYKEVVRNIHEPEVRQIDRKDLEALGETIKDAEVEGIKKTIINIFLGNKDDNKTKLLTDTEVYQKIKDKYGWDQASAVKDEILNVSGIAKDGVDELKDKRELLSKGIKSLPEVKPQTILVKMGANVAAHAGTILEAYSAYGTMKKVKGLQDELSSLSDEKKSLNCNHPSDLNFKKCINISEEQLNKMKIFIKNERGF